MLRILLAAALVATANAMCPARCSGHGTCGRDDSCTCYANWQGVDCASRTCPFAKAWVNAATGEKAAHSYAECSNQGTCDRASGQCECSNGFEGRACDRVACPGGCSDRGTCEFVGGNSWDASKTRACKCDPGFGGIDCSVTLCPLGDDIMTTLTDTSQDSTTDVQEAEVQSVTVLSRGAPINSGNVTFTYTDLYGGSWTTRPVLLPLAKAYLNTNEYVAGTAIAAGTTATEDIRLAASLTDTATTLSAQTGTYYPVGSVDSATEGGYTGLSGTSTTGSDTHFWRVKSFEQANQEVTTTSTITATTSSTTYALLGGKKTTAANWNKLDSATAACSPVLGVQSDSDSENDHCSSAFLSNIATTESDGMYKHIVASTSTLALNSDLFFALRKGDWIFVGENRKLADDDGAGCLMQVAKDYGAEGEDGILYTVADESTPPCLLGAGSFPAHGRADKTAIYSVWRTFAPEGVKYDTSSKKVTKFDASAGTLTIEASGAAGTVYRALMPGMWIRLYYANSPDRGYCDMQLNHFTAGSGQQMNVDATTLSVDPASPTSTNADQSLCQSFSFLDADIGQPSYQHPNSNVAMAYLPNAVLTDDSAVAYGTAGGNTETIAISTSGTTATITQNAAFHVDDGAALVVGALAMVVADDGANDPFHCACTISASPIVGDATNSGASSFTCVAPPTTIAGATVVSCVGKNDAAAADKRIVVYAQNGIYYQHGMTDTLNSKKFEDIAIGDSVRVSNVFQNSESAIQSAHSATFEVFNKDPATSAASSIFFKMGSKPNGGGMYPVIGLLRTDTAAGGSASDTGGLTDANTDTGMFQAELDHSTWFGSTMVIQPVDSASSAWTATDASCIQSAKDVKRVLEELPNRVVEEVSVTMTANTLGLYAYTVTFSGARNSGNQNPLMMNSKGCNADGCQPRYSGVAVQRAWAADDIAIAAGTVTSADKADLTDVVAAAGGETLLFYQLGAMSGKTAPNMYTTTTQVVTDGLSTAVAAQPTSVMVLKNVGDTDPATNAKYFESVTTEITRGTTEAIECSGRGSCESDGTCKCYEGYKGDACHQQSALV